MGELAQKAIERMSYDRGYREDAGIASMDDTKVKMYEDVLTRTELELAGFDGENISTDDILEKGIYTDITKMGAVNLEHASMDDLSAFSDRQLEDFDRQFREVEYGNIDWMPKFQNTTIPRGATKHTFKLDDLQGDYKRITGSSRDLPVSHISGTEYSINVELGGGMLEFNIQELDAANFGGLPLEARKARAVRRAYLENINTLGINTSNANANLIGLMTSGIDSAAVADTVADPNGISSGAALKYWINKIGREIIEDITDARIAIHTGTQGRWGGVFPDDNLDDSNRASFTLSLPLLSLNALFKTYMNTSAGGSNPQTTYDYLTSIQGRRATGVTRIVVVLDFDGSFNSGAAAGFMLTPNDDEAYSFVKAADLTPIATQFQGLSMLVPYYDYYGGMKIIRNKALVSRYSIQAP